MSRYLNGSRVAPWGFVRQLITELGATRRTPVQAEVIDHIRALHRAALQASNRGLYEVQNLQDQLELADREQRRAVLREEALLEALQTRQHRIAELEVTQRELESSWSQERVSHSKKLEGLEGDRATAREEMERLKREVEELKGQLMQARRATREMEDKCSDLEDRLERAEKAADSGKDSRYADELNAARQEAAEARTAVERLQQELEDIKKAAEGRGKESVPQSSLAGPMISMRCYRYIRSILPRS
ncbi:hypothetical protein V6574_19255 [Streptomyces sp. SM1P]